MPKTYLAKKHKLLLVNAPSPKSYAPSGKIFFSLGVISLATHIKNKYPELDIKVIDGDIFTTPQILQTIDKFKPTILGVSVLTPTYTEGLKISKYAKEKYNSVVILGNDHASFFPELIMQNRDFVDYVIKSEIGEPLLSLLIGKLIGKSKKLPTAKMGNDAIFYRENGKIKNTTNKTPNLSDVYKDKKDIPKLDFIQDDYNKYVDEYNRGYGKFHQNKKLPATINTARGCRNCSRRCIYCSIYDLKPKWTSADYFWKVIQTYNKNYGINLFYEVADEFLTFQNFIKDIIKSKPFDLKEKDIEMMIYARADEIVGIPDAVKWLKELNVIRVNLGLDSGDNEMLKLLRKNLRAKNFKPIEINYQAVKLLAENDITIHASFPIGCIGETKNSIKNTLDFIKRIVKDFPKHISALEVSELVPVPNSMVWDIVLGKEKSIYYNDLYSELQKANIQIELSKLKELNKKYNNNDIIDIKQASKDWIKYFTHIKWSDVERMEKEIIKIAKKLKIAYGRAI